jgi:hypothetical protein
MHSKHWRAPWMPIQPVLSFTAPSNLSSHTHSSSLYLVCPSSSFKFCTETPLVPLTIVTNDSPSAYILSFILSKFPPDVSAFQSSLGYEIVSRLSHSLSKLPYSSSGRPEGLDYHCHHTQMAPSILEDISELLRLSFFEEAESSNKKTMHQSKSSRRRAPTMHTEINDRLSQALGHKAPRTRESAEGMIKSIVDSQKDTLKVSTLSSDVVLSGRRCSSCRIVPFHPHSTPRNQNACPQCILSGEHITGRAWGRRDTTRNRSKSFIVHHQKRHNTG